MRSIKSRFLTSFNLSDLNLSEDRLSPESRVLFKKPAKIKVLFYGNCQVDVTHRALMFSNPQCELEYAGNSRRVDHFDEDRKNRLLDWCDHIVTQPIMNKGNPDYYQNLLDRHGDKITFMPYIFLDGFFAMSHAPGSVANTISGVIGQEPVRDMLLERGFDETLARFRSGEINFAHEKRLKYNFEEMERRDAVCHAKVMPFILERYKDERLMITHNHPRPEMINDIASQIATRLELNFNPIRMTQPHRYARITLPEFSSLVTPQTVMENGFSYPYDLNWINKGRRLIRVIAKAYDVPVADRRSDSIVDELE